MLSIPAPPYSSGTAIPMKPSSAIWRISSSGNRLFSSSSAAYGRTSFRANPRAVSWIILCSSVRSNTIVSSPLSLNAGESPPGSLPGEVRLPLFEERGDPFLPVGGGKSRGEQARLERARISEVEVETPVHRHLRRPDGDRTPGEDLFRDLPRRAHQLRRRDDLVHQADLVRPLRGDHLPGEDQLLREVSPDKSLHALRPAVSRDDPEVPLRLAEPGRVRGDQQIARHRHLASPAQRESVDRADDRLGHRLDEGKDALAEEGEIERLQRREPFHHGDVGPRDERFLTGAGQED